MLKIYNTLTKKKEIFKPIKKIVGIYDCGPTVYDYDHIGHAWKYTQNDFLRRVLEYNGYKTKHVMNITDVGHLTSDADTGEDKIEKSAKEKKKNVWEIANFYTKIFLENRKKLNLLEPHIICKATDHIPEMINLIKKLFQKGFVYQISDGVYFNIQKFPEYGKLSGNTLKKIKAGARIKINPEKKHPADFAVWKFSSENVKRQMEWDSPWGKGFPGWHIECSAMSMKYLGESFDIHTGGEDNIFPHHESEIAQSEAVSGKKFVNFWFHVKFLKVEGRKMSKSLKNFLTISDLEIKGFNPLALRYLFLTSHYRKPLNFTWQGLNSAENTLKKIHNFFLDLEKSSGKINKKYQEKFLKSINDDLNMPKAVSVIFEVIKDKKIINRDKKATLLDFDKVLGLGLKDIKHDSIPNEIKMLLEKRKKYRENKEWEKADEIREKIKKLGYQLEDIDNKQKIKKV